MMCTVIKMSHFSVILVCITVICRLQPSLMWHLVSRHQLHWKSWGPFLKLAPEKNVLWPKATKDSNTDRYAGYSRDPSYAGSQKEARNDVQTKVEDARKECHKAKIEEPSRKGDRNDYQVYYCCLLTCSVTQSWGKQGKKREDNWQLSVTSCCESFSKTKARVWKTSPTTEANVDD